MIGLLKKPLSIYQSGLTTNPKRISGNSLIPLGAQNKDIGAVLAVKKRYFQYNDKHYKQLHGIVMGSSVSVQFLLL